MKRSWTNWNDCCVHISIAMYEKKMKTLQILDVMK